MKPYEIERQKRREEASRRLEGFQYTRLATGDAEVWRCKKPGTSAYAFDITITRFGIAVMGDIGGLLFSVGASYGMSFLAGDDVGYYIHSKLQECCRERELDEDYFRQVITDGICRMLADQAEDCPEWVEDDEARRGMFDALKEFVYQKWQVEPSADQPDWYDIHELLEEAESVSTTHDAVEYLQDHCEALGLGQEWWDYDVTKTSEWLLNVLYVVNHAAREIMKIKKPAPGTASAPCGSMGEEVAT